MAEPSSPPVFTFGRLVQWLVLALMLVAILYAGWRSVANWSDITV